MYINNFSVINFDYKNYKYTCTQMYMCCCDFICIKLCDGKYLHVYKTKDV